MTRVVEVNSSGVVRKSAQLLINRISNMRASEVAKKSKWRKTTDWCRLFEEKAWKAARKYHDEETESCEVTSEGRRSPETTAQRNEG